MPGGGFKDFNIRNHSDDELVSDNKLAGGANKRQPIHDDYTSFPTLPDPEQENGKTLSRFFSTTLRKVTNNASTLVNYGRSASETQAKDENVEPKDSTEISQPQEPQLGVPSSTGGGDSETIPTETQFQSGVDQGSMPPTTDFLTAPPTSIPKANPQLIQKNATEGSRLATGSEDPEEKGSTGSSSSEGSASGGGANPTVKTNTTTVNSGIPTGPATVTTAATTNAITTNNMALSSSTATTNQSVSSTKTSTSTPPRVTSSSNGLRLSTLSIPKLQPPPITTTTVTTNNVDSSSSSIMEAQPSSTKSPALPIPAVTNQKSKPAPPTNSLISSSSSSIPSLTTLQNRISTIFNNLPNDIELSDDSGASDTETINNLSFVSSSGASPYRQKSIKTNSTTSPRNKKGSGTNNSSTNISSGSAHKKKHLPLGSGHLSNVILDNARLLLNNGLSNVVHSSASSIMSTTKRNDSGTSRRRKKKPKRSSDNPLKNGGIPRFYWMNDSFVTDCLNCFKPFTAFRRKHHCRFCGQIFCSDCTLFISYNQHKEERKSGGKVDNKKNYSDKLRVCKPCYSDVIVYLSDDSSSDTDEEDTEAVEIEDVNEEPHASREKLPMIEHDNRLSRISSQSINSRRDSLQNDSLILNSNKGFLKQDASIADWSPSRSKRYPAAGSATPEMISMKTVPNHSLHMAIPTTRKGESVEIPVQVGSYSNVAATAAAVAAGSTSTNSLHRTKSNQELAISSRNHAGTPGPYHNGAQKSWLKSYSYLRNVTTPGSVVDLLAVSGSLENISHMYSTFMKKNTMDDSNDAVADGNGTDYLPLTRTTSGQRRTQRHRSSSMIIDTSDNFDVDYDPDIESENEDEKAMSLYTSLNLHSTFGYNAAGSTLSPSQPLSSPVNNSVPTLGEFPRMMVNESRFPRSTGIGSGTGDSVLSKLFQTSRVANGDGENSLNTNAPKAATGTIATSTNTNTSNSTTSMNALGEKLGTISFLEDRPKSDSFRSHERAHASLLRMRSRRKSKSVRNVLILTQSSHKLPSLDTPLGVYQNGHSSPTSTPSSPTPVQHLDQLSAVRSGTFSPVPFEPVYPALTKEDFPETPKITHSYLSDYPGDSEVISRKQSRTTSNTRKLEKVYADYLNRMLVQCLEDCDIRADQSRWTTQIDFLLQQVDNLKLTDTLDIKQYIKIKKILGGKIKDSHVIDGMFMTKNIDSKKMMSRIENPKIALLMFPVEYLKQKEQFISLRIVHSQQSVYITNLVSRLVSLEPDIIVVGDTVCGLAEKLLEEANITVISNTKPQVIERISRYTKADIFQSVNDLFFKKGLLGTCLLFEVRRYLYQNVIKSFVFFTGGDVASGFTIALKGGDEETLNNVKYATESAIIGRLNSKFEISLFKDLGLVFGDGKRKRGILDLTEKLQEITSGTVSMDEDGDESQDSETTLNQETAKFDSIQNENLSDKHQSNPDHGQTPELNDKPKFDIMGKEEANETIENREENPEELHEATDEVSDDVDNVGDYQPLGNEQVSETNRNISVTSKKNDETGDNNEIVTAPIQASNELDVASTDGDQDELNLLLGNTQVDRYISLFNSRIITVSPSVKFSLPTTLTNVAESHKALSSFYTEYKKIRDASNLETLDVTQLISLFKLNISINKLPNGETDLLKILKYFSELHLQNLRVDFQTRSRLWINCLNYTSYQLYPICHKSIHVLNSTVSIKHATPCSGPNIVVIDYYTDNDKCLGLFLDQIFAEALNVCEECGDTYLNHYKSYSHGNGKVDMVLERTDLGNAAAILENKRVMWSYCTECNLATPVVPMSDETYYLSIGKFFELCFWASGVTTKSSNHFNGGCDHDYFKSHVRYVGYNDLAVKMVYLPIDTYEVVVPRKQLDYLPEIDIQLKVELLEQIRKKASNFFNSISNRLNRVKVDTIDKPEEGLARVEELKRKLKEQMEHINGRTMDIYNSTSPSNHLPLNSILRDLQELGVGWDNEFIEFEKSFLPSENEITRITQFHLRRFLMDKYKEGDEKKEDEDEGETICDEKLKEEEKKLSPHSFKTEKNPDKVSGANSPLLESTLENGVTPTKQTTSSSLPHLGNAVDEPINLERSTEIDSLPKQSVIDSRGEDGKSNASSSLSASARQNMVMEKVHRMEALLENERIRELTPVSSPTKLANPIPRPAAFSKSPMKKLPLLSHKNSESSIISKDVPSFPILQTGNGPNKVHHLANFFDQLHFDQISLEFKKQREQELQKKLNRYKAFPILASKPIVEIYNKIEDAVETGADGDIGGVAKAPSANDSIPEILEPVEADTQETSSTAGSGSVLNTPTPISAGATVRKDIEPEKNSLLKSLTTFWADRSTTLWEPLEYPLGSSEHTFADSDVIVREDEPSSLIAFCLSLTDYKQKIQYMADEDRPQSGDHSIISNEINNKKAENFAKLEKKFKKSDLGEPGELEKTMNRFNTTHLKYQYLDGQTILSCKIFYSEQFEAFRKACGNEDSFIQSLSRCVKWDSSGGKSGSSFLKTLDDRYIVKELSKQELESFVAIAPFYFKYMSQSMFNTLTTAIAKIYGFYQINVKNPITGKNFKMDFLIMENLFYNRKTTRIFDLKGSMRNRHVQQTGKENEVLLDENMIEYIYESPVFVREQSKRLLRGSLFNDTAFLSAMDVMDYSLVIGIVDEADNNNKKVLYVGIIDCIRTFTWDKKVENWVKGSNLIGGKKGKDPTIVTPKQYRTRFREAMERYILEVPDCWYEGK